MSKNRCPKCGEFTSQIITIEPAGLHEHRFITGDAFGVEYVTVKESFKCDVCGYSVDGRTKKYLPQTNNAEFSEPSIAAEIYHNKTDRDFLERRMRNFELSAAIACVKYRSLESRIYFNSIAGEGKTMPLSSYEVALMVVLEAARKYERLIYGGSNGEEQSDKDDGSGKEV